jgi:hypothetical protein
LNGNDENNKDGSGMMKMNMTDKREDKILNEMFAAAGEETWDASPGFEGALKARLVAGTRRFQFGLERLIWRAMPAAAVLTVIAVASSVLSGSLSHLDNFIVSRIWDPVVFDDIMALGIF